MLRSIVCRAPQASRNMLPALKHDSILTTVGKTPLVKLSDRINPTPSTIYVKYEVRHTMMLMRVVLVASIVSDETHTTVVF